VTTDGHPYRPLTNQRSNKLAAETLSPPPDTGPSTNGFRFKLGETTKQAGMLVSAQTASMFAGFLASIILGRWMEPAEMGRFAFCLSIILVTSLFFEFGVSSSGARVLALTRDRQGERQALGALVLMTLAISVAFSLFIAAAAEPIDLIFSKDVRWLLVATAALSFFQPFQLFIEQSCQGLNQIRRLSVFQLVMSACYLLALILLVAMHRLTAGTALGAYLAGTAVASVLTLIRMRPSFKGASRYVKLTLKETRGYGFNLYLARISGMASSRSDQLAIGYFLAQTAPLGMYAQAQKFSNPIAMIGRSLAVTRFRAFARLERVPSRITRWNAAALVAASIALIALGPIVLKLVFPKYSEAAPLLVPFAAMNFFVGLFQPYNIFLASHGRGAELRNIVLVVGVVMITGLVVTVPRFGIAGAAWTSAASMALDYVLHLYYYRRVETNGAQGLGARTE
jgi:O-antigen/teichoic acid export membrane protein